jgi:toxin ParE1/3/4
VSFVLEFLPEAAAEVACVTGDYEARAAGLGVRFRTEVESVCSAIMQHPLLWSLRKGGYRRVNLPGFPYYVAFVTLEGLVIIVAVAHSSRRPGFFQTRIP